MKQLEMKQFKSLISHDEANSRVYIMDMHHDDFPEIISYIEELVREKEYTKAFVKVKTKYSPSFIMNGYVIEATVPLFYNGEEDACFLVKYYSEQRKEVEKEALDAFQQMLLEAPKSNTASIDKEYSLRPLVETDTPLMVALFKKVFDSYPFPIFDTAFLIKSMKEDGTQYYGAFHNKELVAISSAECNSTYKNAEMTDFAVNPVHRGKRLATFLLQLMEEELTQMGYKTLYTIARLHSLSMNKTFYNMGYKYSGTLTRNTQISGKIESMNVWYK
ncbi:putative beta-lysine N-acetyltransferase [Bacteroides ihuae]|uniref:putative beta-lysine N-acetyltransferase n=1 Tax=Bacteroides ihuae TaxID=1852362 RepID=UPI0008D8DDEA|nr:putative beta-lysine N-acetyltransferase [Bacteroides ihuae]